MSKLQDVHDIKMKPYETDERGTQTNLVRISLLKKESRKNVWKKSRLVLSMLRFFRMDSTGLVDESRGISAFSSRKTFSFVLAISFQSYDFMQ